jgi:hypothetical protein
MKRNKANSDTHFPYWLWFWTLSDESLFDLTPTELKMFELFVEEAAKNTAPSPPIQEILL